MKNQIIDGMLGLCVADALGVPVEFYGRSLLDRSPVIGMRSYGTHGQPAGTWSDDTSMTLCLVDALERDLDCDRIMQNFLGWIEDMRFTPHGRIFDIGMTCREAIFRYEKGAAPLACGGRSELNNGNGSLMRILPMAYYVNALHGIGFVQDDAAMDAIHDVSSLTHAHPRSTMACGIYVAIAVMLMHDASIGDAIQRGVRMAHAYYSSHEAYQLDMPHYERIWSGDLWNTSRDDIRSSGYVVDTLEAALWCLATTETYEQCVLRAVNLGDDTDTVAAVAGGLAGVYYGQNAIPSEWVDAIARLDDIRSMCDACQLKLDAF